MYFIVLFMMMDHVYSSLNVLTDLGFLLATHKVKFTVSFIKVYIWCWSEEIRACAHGHGVKVTMAGASGYRCQHWACMADVLVL